MSTDPIPLPVVAIIEAAQQEYRDAVHDTRAMHGRYVQLLATFNGFPIEQRYTAAWYSGAAEILYQAVICDHFLQNIDPPVALAFTVMDVIAPDEPEVHSMLAIAVECRCKLITEFIPTYGQYENRIRERLIAYTQLVPTAGQYFKA